MAIPSLNKLEVFCLSFLAEKKDFISMEQIREQVIKAFAIPSSDLEIKNTSGEIKLFNRIGWAIFELKNAETVEKSGRGVSAQFKITETGVDFLAQFPDFSITQLREETPYKNKIELWKLNRETKDSEETEEEITTNIVLQNDNYYDDIEFNILNRLKNLGESSVNKGSRFEKLCLQLLEAMGYGTAEQTGGAGDRGIDGFLTRDTLGFEKIGVQCKCYTDSKVDDNEITKFAHGLKNVHGCTKGVFITTSDFLPRARKAAEETKDVKIILIHGLRLARLMREYKIGVKIIDTNYIYNITIGENS